MPSVPLVIGQQYADMIEERWSWPEAIDMATRGGFDGILVVHYDGSQVHRTHHRQASEMPDGSK